MFLASIRLLKELIMKKSFKLLFGSFVIFSLIACGTQTAKSESGKQESSVQESTTPHSSEESIKPSSISSSSEEPSSSVPTPTYCHVVFQNYDETVLLEIDVLEGNEAVYSGETPTKPEDDEFTYEFEKWDQEDNLKVVTSDVTTKAVFTPTAKENWGPIIWF